MPGQRGSTGFRAQPEELHAAGRAAADLAAQIPQALRPVLAASDAAAGGLTSCLTGAALQECTEAWRALLLSLAAEMDRQAQRLTESACGYEGADATAAAGFTPSAALTTTLAPHAPPTPTLAPNAPPTTTLAPRAAGVTPAPHLTIGR